MNKTALILLFLFQFLFHSVNIQAQDEEHKVIVFGRVSDISNGTFVANKQVCINSYHESYPDQDSFTKLTKTDEFGCYIDTITVYKKKGCLVANILDTVINLPSQKTYRFTDNNYDYIELNLWIKKQSSNSFYSNFHTVDHADQQYTLQYFIDSDIKDIVSIDWDFGDNNYSTEKNPTHQYKKAGLYLVWMKMIAIVDNKVIEILRKKYIYISKTKQYILAGHAFEANVPLKKGRAYLYQEKDNGAIIPIDMVQFNNNNGLYHFEKIALGVYIVKIVPDMTIYPDIIPAYYKDKIAWKTAERIELTEDNLEANIELYYPSYYPFTGEMILTGSVEFIGNSEYAKQKNYTSPSIAGIEILLLSGETEEALACTFTDEMGYYYFYNVSPGYYYILADFTGANTTKYVCNIPAKKSTDKMNIDIKLYYNLTSVPEIIGIPEGLKFSPNPANREINISSNYQGTGKLKIYNGSGQVVMERNLNTQMGNLTQKVVLDQLPKGCYLIELIGEKSRETGKLIIQ